MEIDKKGLKNKSEIFVEEFIGCFEEKLSTFHNEGSGKVGVEVSYSTLGSIVKTGFESLMGTAASAIPLAGPFLTAALVSLPTQAYEFYQGRQIRKESEEISNQVSQIGEEDVMFNIHEGAIGICRLFEFQLAMLKETSDVRKAAVFAVDRIFSAASDTADGNKCLLEYSELISLLMKRSGNSLGRMKDKILVENTVNLVDKSCKSWQLHDMFTEVGLRAISDDEVNFDFKLLKTQSKSIPKCGFRNEHYIWENKEELYVKCAQDEVVYDTMLCTAGDVPSYTASNSVYMKYDPVYQYVSQMDVDAYVNLARTSKEPQSFIHFLQRMNAMRNNQNTTLNPLPRESMEGNNFVTDIIPVFRNITFPAKLSKCNFSYCVFDRTVFRNNTMNACKFNHATMHGTRWYAVTLVHCQLRFADMRWSHFYNVNLSMTNNLLNTDLSYCILDHETDLTDNLSFASAIAEKAHIWTNKVEFTILKRLFNQEAKQEQIENAVAKLEQTVKDLMEKQAEYEIKLKRGLARGTSVQMEDAEIYNVREPVGDFTGREAPLERLREYFLAHKKSPAYAVICAAGGVGKTQVAIQFASKNRASYYDRVFWIAGESRASIIKSYRELAAKLRMNVESVQDDDVLKAIMNKLSAMTEPMLLVYDNAENHQLVAPYIPQSTCIHVLLTTRDPTWPRNFHVEVLELYSTEESISFVTKVLPHATSEDAKALAELFGNLPLGLAQSTAYILENSLAVREYIEYFSKYKSQLLKENIANDPHTSGVFTTFSMAVDDLMNNSKCKHAVDIIYCCAFYYADAIPESIFESIFDGNKYEQIRSIAALKVGSLVTIKVENNGMRYLYIHRLVQEVIRMKLSESGQYAEVLLRAMKIALQQMSYGSYDVLEIITKNRPMLLHALSLIAHFNEFNANNSEEELLNEITNHALKIMICNVELYARTSQHPRALEAIQQAHKVYQLTSKSFKDSDEYKGMEYEVLYHMSAAESALKNYDVAQRLIEQATKLAVSLYTTHSERYAECLQAQSAICYYRNDYQGSLKLDKQILALRLQLHPAEHPLIAKTHNALGSSYFCLDNMAKSNEHSLESLRIRRKVLGTHPDTAVSLNNLGSNCKDEGKFDEALSYFKQSLKMYEETYGGREHLEINRTVMNIASVYERKGDFKEAKRLYEENLAVAERMFGKVHFLYAERLVDLAEFYVSRNDFTKGIELHTEVLAIVEKALGKNNVEYPKALRNLANAHDSAGNGTKALEFMEAAHRSCVAINGEKHRDTANSYFSLGRQYQIQNNYDKAYDCFNKCNQICIAINGRPDADGLNGMAYIMRDRRQLDKALDLYKQACEACKTLYGAEHLNNVTYMFSLAEFYESFMNDYAKALSIYEDATRLNEKIYGRNHASVAECLMKQASTLYTMCDEERADAAVNEALQIRKKIYGADSAEVAATLKSQSDRLKAKEDYSGALTLLDKVLAIQTKIFGPKTFIVSETLTAKALVYDRMKEFNDAETLYKKSMAIRKELYGASHSTISDNLYSLGTLFCTQDKFDTSLTFFEQALQMRLKIYGDEHDLVADCIREIAFVYCLMEKFDKAIERHKEALQILSKVYGEKSLKVGTAYSHIGFVYYQQAQYDRAVEYFEREAVIRENVYGYEHPEVAEMYCVFIGAAYSALGETKKALNAYKNAVSIMEAVYPSADMRKCKYLEELGDAYANAGLFNDACGVYERMLRVIEETIGKSTDEAVMLCKKIGETYAKAGATRRAQEYQRRAETQNNNGRGGAMGIASNNQTDHVARSGASKCCCVVS